LSALDAHVKKKIFEQVLCSELKGKTRVLVTHALDCLPKVDRILLMEKGKIVFDGDFDELLKADIKQISDNIHLFHVQSETEESDTPKEESKDY